MPRSEISIMNTKRPKIWTSEDQILACIDRVKRLASNRLAKSNMLAERAREKFGRVEQLRFELLSKPHLTEFQRSQIEGRLRGAELSAAATKEKADIASKAYHRAIDKTLPRLGEILAAFRTEPMKGILGEYRGVCVR